MGFGLRLGLRVRIRVRLGFGTVRTQAYPYPCPYPAPNQAACVWETLFGHSLTPLADGTRQGFIKTCCSIHQVIGEI